MQAYEMNNKATEGLAKKMAVYREKNPLQGPSVTKTRDFDTYEDAKNAGDVQGMLKHKLGNYRKRVVNFSNEVYNTLPIKDILKGVDELKVSVQQKADAVETLREAQRQRIEKEYKQIGGLTGVRLIVAIEEALSDYEKGDETFLQAVADAQEEKRKYTAYCNARDMYIEDNKDLIEAEREKAREKTRKEEFKQSGILEMLGVSTGEE
mgnify:CR=1 FL=1